MLLVEDEAVTRTALTVLLEYQGAVVVAVGSIAEAMGAIATGLKLDLLVTNIRLPDGNGAQVLNAVRRQDEQLGQQTPAIALSGEVFETIRMEYDAAGFQLYIAKPFNSQILLRDIDRLLQERRR